MLRADRAVFGQQGRQVGQVHVGVEVEGYMAISDRDDYGFLSKIRAAFPGNAG